MQFQYLGDNNRYEIQEPVGRGIISAIYRGRDTVLHREVAIKVLRDIYSVDVKFVTRFQREAKLTSGLQHPNIVQVYDYGQTNGNYFIVILLFRQPWRRSSCAAWKKCRRGVIGMGWNWQELWSWCKG